MKLTFRLVLLLLLAVRAVAQEPETVLQVVTGTPEDTELMSVIAGAARVELLRAGLLDLSPPLLGVTDEEAVREAVVTRNVDYLVVIRFEGEGQGTSAQGEIAFDISLYRASDGGVLGETTIDTFVDLTLDSRVARAVRGLVYDAGIDGERIVLEEEQSEDETENPSVEVASSDSDNLDDNGRLPPVIVTPSVVAPQGPPEKGLGVSVLGAPLLVVGEASNTFQYGIAAFLSTTYRPGFSRLGFETGLRAGAIQIFPNADILPGQAYLILGGAELSLGTVSRRPARLAVQVSGGAAVIVVRRDGGDLLAKTVPYVSGGIEAIAAIWRKISIGIEADYVVVFEEQLPVMGLTPAVVVRLGP